MYSRTAILLKSTLVAARR